MEQLHSIRLSEADLECLLPETSPAEHKLILFDETFLVGAASAVTGVLSEFAWM